jgi:putative mRNA 3-end processing factor
MMRLRYGDNFAGSTQAIAYGEEIRLGDVKVKFHPAGHVLGSAQIAVSCKDTCIVVSGDYKGCPGPDVHAVRGGALRRLHHRGHFRFAGVPSWGCRRRGQEAPGLGGPVSERAHLVGAYSLGKGATGDRACARPVTTRRSTCMAQWKRSRAITKAAALRSASCASCAA